MVQRKVFNKLGIGIQFQADGDKSEKLLMNLKKPSSLQQQDGKNLKKKMKKSGSMKRQDFEKLWLTKIGRQQRRPGKAPPPQPQPILSVPTTAQTPQKQPTIKGGAALELLTPNYMKSTSSSEARKERSQVRSSSRSPKTSPESINSRRKSSLKILTKTPSFKPARASTKIRSPVVLCENLEVQRSTCSSTLKDYKFPSYLSLNPGGTESEGASLMKVCPYTYCSLNGHKHAPVPPLKKFLSAKRLMIKTQRGLKRGCLSPRRSRPAAGDGVNFGQEVPISPLIQEEHEDFYVEIYGVKKEDSGDEKEEDIDQNGDAAVFFSEEIGGAEEIDIPSKPEEESKLGCLRVPPETTQSVQSDASDMDWEAGEYSALYLDDDDDLDCSLKGIKECDCKEVDSSEVIFNPDEIPADEESWSSESTGSYEYMDKLNIDITYFVFEDQTGKLEDAKQDKSDIVFSDLDSEEEKQNITMLEDETSICDGPDVLGCQGFDVPDNVSTGNPNEKSEENISFDNVDGIDVKDQSDAEESHTRNAEYQGHLSNHCNEAENNNMAENRDHMVQTEVTNPTKAETKDTFLTRATLKESDNAFDTCKNLKATTRCKRSIDECDESRQFNPRAPNYLEVEPDPDAEKVDLKHQMMEERRNSEEWMLDYALRQAVTKLAPARKRKVALLVEAFEKVLPCEPHLTHTSAALDRARPIQACR